VEGDSEARHGFTRSAASCQQFPSIAKDGDIEAVGEFFRVHPFWRLGAVFTTATKLSDELSLMQTMKAVLQKRIDDIVRRTLCKDVVIIFESSDIANKLIQESFQGFEFWRGSKRIPSESYFMPKSAADPALEVADFVMHAIGRQARHNINQRAGFVPDFRAVFQAVDRNLTSYIEISVVMYSKAAT